jgi:hypothetical protein
MSIKEVKALSFYDEDLKPSYFKTRMDELGVTPELNSIELFATDPTFDTERKGKFSIFFPDNEDNICIRVYNVKREIIYYLDKRSDNPTSTSNRYKQFILKRLKTPVEYTDNGRTKLKKYDIPKGAGTFPFITPGVLEKYEAGETIDTLVLTEGYFKAFKGYIHGLDIIGLSSITHIKDKETETMYGDIIDIIQKCKVKTVIVLYDGDCRNISLQALSHGDDLYTRPAGFLSSITKAAELLKDYKVSIYFACIASEEIEGNPKGLDDLYINQKEQLENMKGAEGMITADLISISRPAQYFHRFDVTANTNKVAKFFQINDINEFYKYHQPLIKDKEFVFRGSKYIWNENKKICDLIVPKNVLEYFQVGDNYYKYVKVPNKYKQLELRIVSRQIGTITKLIGKGFTSHIPYYDEFCNVPDHVSFTQVINNCFNLYSTFEHEPEEGECSTILNFCKHIFGPQYELGMDYVQLLYQQPWQKLPILCLVSSENQTGKSTFIQLLKAIFTGNCIIIGNDDLANQFNYSWAGKLLICCEESFIEKKAGVEKIKSLSTGDKIVVNRKGKDHNEIDFFGKFILASNNEDNFILAGKNDERYWVIKVPVIAKRDPNMLKRMIDEIPGFLHYLNHRKLTTQNEDRMWFKPEIRRTEALAKLIEANKTRIESEIQYTLKEMFTQFGFRIIMLSPEAINIVLFNKKYPTPYLAKEIQKFFKPIPYINAHGVQVSHRFYWPRWSTEIEGEMDRSLKFTGRPYLYKREDFLTEAEIKHMEKSNNIINDFSERTEEDWLVQLAQSLPF